MYLSKSGEIKDIIITVAIKSCCSCNGYIVWWGKFYFFVLWMKIKSTFIQLNLPHVYTIMVNLVTDVSYYENVSSMLF